MKYATLGKSKLQISRIGLGTNAGGHNLFANVDEKAGIKFVTEALENGINFIDTADSYGLGRSEELIGQILKGRDRDSFVIATKGGNEVLPNGNKRHNSRPEYIRKALERSLKRLQLDEVDLYYLHFPDNETPISETMGELSRLKQEGKIKAIGISNVSLQQLKEADESCELSALQAAYNMLDRSAEKDLLPYCSDHHISFIPYGPLAYGLLGGNYTKDLKLDKKDWRSSVPLFQPGVFVKMIDKVDRLKKFAVQKGISMNNLALAWLLTQNGVDSVIPGGKNAGQVRDNVLADDVTLTPEDLASLEKMLH
ncbi:aldo/keto reductase [Terrilactibacillus sp. S3-3]|nr:aldo/keto reductase [Terrilactibacillus sp. S3-3]